MHRDKYNAAWGIKLAPATSAVLESRSKHPSKSKVHVPVALQRKRRSATQRLNDALTAVERLEEELDIECRWTPATSEYSSTLKYIEERKYYAAVDKLELLLIQRLGELARLNVGGVGTCLIYIT